MDSRKIFAKIIDGICLGIGIVFVYEVVNLLKNAFWIWGGFVSIFGNIVVAFTGIIGLVVVALVVIFIAQLLRPYKW